MAKLDVYSGRDLQNFITLLNQFELEGMMDVRVIREQVQRSMGESLKPHPGLRSTSNSTVCPSCGGKTLSPTKLFEGVVCRCGYSKMNGVE